MLQKLINAITSTILALIFLAGAWGVHFVFNDPMNDWWFDEKIWKSQHYPSFGEVTRGRMTYDLTHRVLEPGMSRQEVYYLLGPPDKGMSATSFAYDLGYWSTFFRMEPNVLGIQFDQQGKLISSSWG